MFDAFKVSFRSFDSILWYAAIIELVGKAMTLVTDMSKVINTIGNNIISVFFRLISKLAKANNVMHLFTTRSAHNAHHAIAHFAELSLFRPGWAAIINLATFPMDTQWATLSKRPVSSVLFSSLHGPCSYFWGKSTRVLFWVIAAIFNITHPVTKNALIICVRSVVFIFAIGAHYKTTVQSHLSHDFPSISGRTFFRAKVMFCSFVSYSLDRFLGSAFFAPKRNFYTVATKNAIAICGTKLFFAMSTRFHSSLTKGIAPARCAFV